MLMIILAVILCSIALTALKVRSEAIQYKVSTRHDPITFGEVIVTFIVYFILISTITWLIDLLLNTQVTLQ